MTFSKLLDTMSAFHTFKRPMCGLEDMKSRLPCHEKLWRTASPGEWATLKQHFESKSLHLQKSLQTYMQKKSASILCFYASVRIFEQVNLNRSYDRSDVARGPIAKG